MLFQKTRLLSNELNDTLKAHNLYSSQWTVLYCVHMHGSMTMKEMTKYLNVEAPTVTRTVSRLEELGWLTVQPGKDRREKIVRLCVKAEKKLPEIEKTIVQFEAEFLEQLTEDEQGQFMILLRKLEKKG